MKNKSKTLTLSVHNLLSEIDILTKQGGQEAKIADIQRLIDLENSAESEVDGDDESMDLGSMPSSDFTSITNELDAAEVPYEIVKRGNLIGIKTQGDNLWDRLKDNHAKLSDNLGKIIGEKDMARFNNFLSAVTGISNLGGDTTKDDDWRSKFARGEDLSFKDIRGYADYNKGSNKSYNESLEKIKNFDSSDITKRFLASDRGMDEMAGVLENLKQNTNQSNQGSEDQDQSKAWYEDQDIKNALEGQNKDDNNVQIFGAVQVSFSDLAQKSIMSALKELGHGKDAVDKDKVKDAVLMPLNVNDIHWTGGAMMNIGDKPCFVHNDPMGEKIDDSFSQELKNHGIVVIDLKQKQQDDDHSCGPFTANNLKKFAELAQDLKERESDKENISPNDSAKFAEEIKNRLNLCGPESATELRESQLDSLRSGDASQNEDIQPKDIPNYSNKDEGTSR